MDTSGISILGVKAPGVTLTFDTPVAHLWSTRDASLSASWAGRGEARLGIERLVKENSAAQGKLREPLALDGSF